MGNRIKTFRRKVVPSERRDPIAHLSTIVSKQNGILSCTAAKTSKLKPYGI